MMSGLHRVLLLITLFSFWFIGFIDHAEANYLGISLVLTIGLIHGANDLRIIGKLNGSNRFSKKKQLSLYLFMALFTFFIFYLFPVTALIIFLLFSCYHFGEQHWLEGQVRNSVILGFFAFIYGLLIISMILKFNSLETILVLKDITHIEISSSILNIVFYISAFIFLILTYLLRSVLLPNFNEFFKEFFLILILGVIFKISTLIWSFAFYFIVWHAIPSLYSQIKVLYGKEKGNGVLAYLKHSIFYWLISLVWLTIAIFFFKENTTWIISIFFPFIAALTIPHVLVMSKMFEEYA
ncbi:Brp/Blh family beta-carotene 15,15'-dioxygenase [Gillisia sp. JM1]|uniref:Brp/Blh family beta-carotene 15,15'-dioxygenase n=1 Tax=Gillisia sp. JM1 TaxID=1283286 RepID=UPI00042A1FAE|nr:Brp/Blh family beta-carotene 15,15'-dioxygenase [Gillisia sp. JM1]